MNTRIPLIELQYLPPVAYLALFIHFEPEVEQWEHYHKGSYRNRCHIATANGLLRLSLPLRKGKHRQKPVREVELAYDEPWQHQHWQAILSAYGNAPFFEHYAPLLEPLYKKRFRYLFDFNRAALATVLSLLPSTAPLHFSASYRFNTDPPVWDLREQIHPKKDLSATLPGFHAQPYPQVFREKTGFLPNLSIIDLLFCAGPEAALVLEQSFRHEPDS